MEVLTSEMDLMDSSSDAIIGEQCLGSGAWLEEVAHSHPNPH